MLIELINDAIINGEADLASLPETPKGLLNANKRTAVHRAIDCAADRLRAKIDTLKQALEIAREHGEEQAPGILDAAIMRAGAMDSPYQIGRIDRIAGIVEALEAISGWTSYTFTEYTKTFERIGS